MSSLNFFLDHLQKTFHSRPSSLHPDDLLKISVVPDYSFWQHASQSDDQSHLQKRLSLEIVLFVRGLHERWQYNIKLLEVHQRSDGMEYTGILFSIREVIWSFFFIWSLYYTWNIIQSSVFGFGVPDSGCQLVIMVMVMVMVTIVLMVHRAHGAGGAG